SCMRIRKRNCCTSSVIENQYFSRTRARARARDSRSHQHPFELRNGMEEFLVLLVRAEAHDALDAGAIVPAAVEQDDFAAGGKMSHVALEIPLRAFALVGSRQRGDPADPRVEALGDALDDPALAGGIAALEEDDHL